MSGPGSGRYTVYVPNASPRNALLAKLFNGRAGGKASFYGADYQTDPTAAAKAVVATATAKVNSAGVGGLFPSDGKQAGDAQMFPKGVEFGFGNAPTINEAEVKWSKPGGPANPFMPDPSSPGPGRTEGVDKDADPKITVADVKGAGYVPGGPGTGTTSPSTTSSVFGAGPLGKTLTMGQSPPPEKKV